MKKWSAFLAVLTLCVLLTGALADTVRLPLYVDELRTAFLDEQDMPLPLIEVDGMLYAPLAQLAGTLGASVRVEDGAIRIGRGQGGTPDQPDAVMPVYIDGLRIVFFGPDDQVLPLTMEGGHVYAPLAQLAEDLGGRVEVTGERVSISRAGQAAATAVPATPVPTDTPVPTATPMPTRNPQEIVRIPLTGKNFSSYFDVNVDVQAGSNKQANPYPLYYMLRVTATTSSRYENVSFHVMVGSVRLGPVTMPVSGTFFQTYTDKIYDHSNERTRIINNTNKFMLAIAASVSPKVTDVSGTILLHWSDIEPEVRSQYESAVKYMAQKKYDQALKALETPASYDYMDSKALVQECRQLKKAASYEAAMALKEKQQYAEAAEAFAALESYQDSAAQVQECRELSLAARYDQAAALRDAGDFVQAGEQFAALGDFRDSADQKAVCDAGVPGLRYNEAAALLAEGKYEEAYEIFTDLNGYADSEEQILACKEGMKGLAYDEAAALLAGGEYDQALTAFNELNDFRDSKDQAAICRQGLTYLEAKEVRATGDIAAANRLYESIAGFMDAAELVDKAGEARQAEAEAAAGKQKDNADNLFMTGQSDQAEEAYTKAKDMYAALGSYDAATAGAAACETQIDKIHQQETDYQAAIAAYKKLMNQQETYDAHTKKYRTRDVSTIFDVFRQFNKLGYYKDSRYYAAMTLLNGKRLSWVSYDGDSGFLISLHIPYTDYECYINVSTGMVINEGYTFLPEGYPSWCGDAVIARDNGTGKLGLLSVHGEWVAPCEYDDMFFQEETGCMIARKGDKHYLLSTSGTVMDELTQLAEADDKGNQTVRELAFDSVVREESFASDGAIQLTYKAGGSTIVKVFDCTGMLTGAADADAGLATVYADDRTALRTFAASNVRVWDNMAAYQDVKTKAWGLLDVKTGRTTMKPSNIMDFSLFNEKGVALITRKTGKYVLMNAKGKTVSQEYPYIGKLGDGYYCFGNGKAFGYMDREGKIVVKPKYLWAEPLTNGGAAAMLSTKRTVTRQKDIEYTVSFIYLDASLTEYICKENVLSSISSSQEKDMLQSAVLPDRFPVDMTRPIRDTYLLEGGALHWVNRESSNSWNKTGSLQVVAAPEGSGKKLCVSGVGKKMVAANEILKNLGTPEHPLYRWWYMGGPGIDFDLIIDK